MTKLLAASCAASCGNDVALRVRVHEAPRAHQRRVGGGERARAAAAFRTAGGGRKQPRIQRRC